MTRPPPDYQPLLRALLAIALGILIDFGLGLTPWLWCFLFILSFTSWYALFQKGKYQASSLALLLCVLALGGTWHNLQWNWIGKRDIATFGKYGPNPIVVRGTIAKQPIWLPVSEREFGSQQNTERAKLDLRVDSIRDGEKFLPASGTLQIFCNGRTLGLSTGERIEAIGNLAPVSYPTNPGDFDFQKFMRRQHILCRLEASTHDSIQKLETGNPFHRFISQLRTRLDEILWQYLKPTHAPLASAMLLGNRSQLTPESREAFLISGTIHILAISGLHVGILAGFFLFVTRFGFVPRRLGLWGTIAFVFFYAILVEMRPPVTRAAVLISVFCYCRIIGRTALSFNSLAFAAIIVLVINPMELFAAGAQLSFLAVATLIHFKGWLKLPPSSDPIDQLIEKSLTNRERMQKYCLRLSYSAVAVSAIIWLIALPAVASQFHIVAPVALLANPILLLPLFSSLFFGTGLLFLGAWCPILAKLMAVGCDTSLLVIQKTVQLSSQLPGGHWWTAGPDPSMVIGFYLSLLIFFFWLKSPQPKWLLTFGCLWFLFGWVIPDFQAHWKSQMRKNLVMTVLDVGHGGCVLLELPNGKNVLYDCGRYGSENGAESAAASLFWQKRIRKLDAVFISHADSDHFNGLPGLAEKFKIERVIISKNLERNLPQNPTFRNALGHLEKEGVLRKTVSEGDLIGFGSSVKLAILNPPHHSFTTSDNEDSIVVEIEFQGIRILLPGDLEGQSLSKLLQSNSSKYDIAMAPHHGSRNSAPEEFIQWCRPSVLIASAGRGKNTEILDYAGRHPYPAILHTAHTGAVQIEIQNDAFQVKTRHGLHAEVPIKFARPRASNILDYE